MSNSRTVERLRTARLRELEKQWDKSKSAPNPSKRIIQMSSNIKDFITRSYITDPKTLQKNILESYSTNIPKNPKNQKNLIEKISETLGYCHVKDADPELELNVMKAIMIREGLLLSLRSLVEDNKNIKKLESASKKSSNSPAITTFGSNVIELLAQIRESTLNYLDALCFWRNSMIPVNGENQPLVKYPFVWENQNYTIKLISDLNFLHENSFVISLLNLSSAQLYNNPLMLNNSLNEFNGWITPHEKASMDVDGKTDGTQFGIRLRLRFAEQYLISELESFAPEFFQEKCPFISNVQSENQNPINMNTNQESNVQSEFLYNNNYYSNEFNGENDEEGEGNILNKGSAFDYDDDDNENYNEEFGFGLEEPSFFHDSNEKKEIIFLENGREVDIPPSSAGAQLPSHPSVSSISSETKKKKVLPPSNSAFDINENDLKTITLINNPWKGLAITGSVCLILFSNIFYQDNSNSNSNPNTAGSSTESRKKIVKKGYFNNDNIPCDISWRAFQSFIKKFSDELPFYFSTLSPERIDKVKLLSIQPFLNQISYENSTSNDRSSISPSSSTSLNSLSFEEAISTDKIITWVLKFSLSNSKKNLSKKDVLPSPFKSSKVSLTPITSKREKTNSRGSSKENKLIEKKKNSSLPDSKNMKKRANSSSLPSLSTQNAQTLPLPTSASASQIETEESIQPSYSQSKIEDNLISFSNDSIQIPHPVFLILLSNQEFISSTWSSLNLYETNPDVLDNLPPLVLKLYDPSNSIELSEFIDLKPLIKFVHSKFFYIPNIFSFFQPLNPLWWRQFLKSIICIQFNKEASQFSISIGYNLLEELILTNCSYDPTSLERNKLEGQEKTEVDELLQYSRKLEEEFESLPLKSTNPSHLQTESKIDSEGSLEKFSQNQSSIAYDEDFENSGIIEKDQPPTSSIPSSANSDKLEESEVKYEDDYESFNNTNESRYSANQNETVENDTKNNSAPLEISYSAEDNYDNDFESMPPTYSSNKNHQIKSYSEDEEYKNESFLPEDSLEREEIERYQREFDDIDDDGELDEVIE